MKVLDNVDEIIATAEVTGRHILISLTHLWILDLLKKSRFVDTLHALYVFLISL